MRNKFLMIVAALSMSLAAQAKRAFTIPDIYRVQNVNGIAFSADGKKVVFGRSIPDFETRRSASNLYVMDMKSGTTRQLTRNNRSYYPVWSNDGKSIYYSSLINHVLQLFSLDLNSGEKKQITDYALGIESPKVSPDGKLVAFVAKVNPAIGADAKKNIEWKEKKQDGPVHAHIADKLLFRHWTQYDDGFYNHIIVYNSETNTYTDVAPGEFHSPVFSPSGYDDAFSFSPDSKEICFSSNRTDHPEANTNADLWTVSVEGGEPKCITAENKAWDGTPQYSPDGRYIAYRKQRVESYESDQFILTLYDRKAGTHQMLTEKLNNWVDSYKFTADGSMLYFLVEERGYNTLYKLELKKNKLSRVITNRAIMEFDVDNKGNLVYTYTRTGKPNALYGAEKGLQKNEKQLTHYNDSLEAEVDFRPSEAMWVEGADGDSVEFFVVKPFGFDPAKKYPVIINVHGGPQMQWMDSYRADWQVYPGAGYIVVYPNPHGSTGYGQAFTRAISGNWGTKPFEDVMKVTDAVEQLPYVDKDRIGAMGWSYGGYFMNWLQGHTKRYKCLASMMGLFNLNEMWGTTEELWFPNFDLQGQPWNSDLYKKFSPSEYVQNFATPALIITGERDYRVSYNQSLAYFTTLQTLGIPSRLIVYDNDGHWPSNTSMLVYYNAHLEWFNKYLGGAPAPWKTEDMINNQLGWK